MNPYDFLNLKDRYPQIAENMVEDQKELNGDIVIVTKDGKQYLYDFLTVTCREIHAPGYEMTEAEFKTEFGIRLHKIMRRKGVTQLELSDKTGISRQTINSYLAGKNVPSFYKVSAIARALNCSIDEFILT